MNERTILRCLIPSTFCGKAESSIPASNLRENIRYTERGSPITCLKKGVGIGRQIERQSALPSRSLQNIKYIGKIYEERFMSKRVRTLSQLVSYIRNHSSAHNGRFLREVLTNASGQVDQRAMNSVIHFLYYENESIRPNLPICRAL